MHYASTQVVSEDEIESIHQASLKILSEFGMDLLDSGAHDLLIEAGAKVESGTQRVCVLIRKWCLSASAQARANSSCTHVTPITLSTSVATMSRSDQWEARQTSWTLTELSVASTTGFEIEIIGHRRPSTLQLEPALDPNSSCMRI